MASKNVQQPSNEGWVILISDILLYDHCEAKTS